HFLGLQNFTRFFTDPSTPGIFANTLWFVVGSVTLQLGLGLGLALLLNLPYRGRVIVRTVILATWIIPEIVVGFVWSTMLAGANYGLVNAMLAPLGVPTVNWLGDRNLALACLVVANVWRGTAFTMVLQLAALQSVPAELHEASAIDGATSWQDFRYVTLPMLSSTMVINLINNTLGTFNVTALVFALTGGGPARGTEVLAMTMYNAAFKQYDLGFASSIALVLFAINVALVVVYVRFFGRSLEDTA
ncbi:MAG TPA: sugar ABC transporter permease, partial [Deinococcales bacterium]|nr:sugar ABC transporter permease [Deinococcales bacterium]